MMKKVFGLIGLTVLTSIQIFSVAAAETPSVVINEVAYRGTTAFSYDEWIELFNPGSESIDLSGWQLVIGANAIPLQGMIPSRGYYLLERTDDQTISDIAADKIFTGSLTDSGILLQLKDPSEKVVDHISMWAIDLSKPPDGFSTRSSLERVDPFGSGDDSNNWRINNQQTINGRDADGNPIFGTPKSQNSTFVFRYGYEGLIDVAGGSEDIVAEISSANIIISRIFPNPKGKDDGKEWIEIQNQSEKVASLQGWKLDNREDSSKPFLITDLVLSPQATHQFFSSETKLTLRNTADQVRLFDPQGSLVDQLEWTQEIAENLILSREDFIDPSKYSFDEGIVLKVIDGDTIDVELFRTGEKKRVRFIGADTPETVHPFKKTEFFGEEATQYTRSQLEGKVVRLEYDQNKYDSEGRLLSYVFLNDRHFNAELIEKGFARAYLKYPFRFADEFRALELRAREAGVGMWQSFPENRPSLPVRPARQSGGLAGTIDYRLSTNPQSLLLDQKKQETKKEAQAKQEKAEKKVQEKVKKAEKAAKVSKKNKEKPKQKVGQRWIPEQKAKKGTEKISVKSPQVNQPPPTNEDPQEPFFVLSLLLGAISFGFWGFKWWKGF